ncbi:T6SS immunity protein Tdi1 domain-containing protein [Chitinimonas naiadis]
MSLSWSDLICTPDDDAIQHLLAAWGWLLDEPFSPLLFSSLGDMFFEKQSGGVYWLNTGTAEVTQVADTVDAFQALLGGEQTEEWFMPPLIEALHEAGLIPAQGQCYSYKVLPVFAEGKYEVDNFKLLAAGEHFTATAHVLKQIQALPDGSTIRLHNML